MMVRRTKTGLTANLLLLLVLAGAQSGTLAHVFEHDAATPMSQACATCFTLSQLDSSSVDAFAFSDNNECVSRIQHSPQSKLEARHSFDARQRGPPEFP